MKKNSIEKIIKHTLAALCIAFFANQSFADISKKEIKDRELEADKNMSSLKYFAALQNYLVLDSLTNHSGLYNYPIGFCYLSIGNEDAALPFFEKLVKGNAKSAIASHYFLGQCYQLQHRFDEAIKEYKVYRMMYGSKKTKANKVIILMEINKHIDECENGKVLVGTPANIEIKNMGPEINSKYPDYAPLISADGSTLLITSSRASSTGGLIDDFDGNFYEDIYISKKTNNRWSLPLGLGDKINTAGHESNVSLSPDGYKLVFYHHPSINPNNKFSGDLFTSILKGDQWTTPERISGKINSGDWEPSGFFTPDEKSFIFASAKKDGQGGTDLYMAAKNAQGEWETPVNLGKTINTAYNEDSPFMLPDSKTLYFSSEGHNSMGGHDIFMSEYNAITKEWSKPQNLGYPINSAHDDIYFSLSADGTTAYFSAKRAGDTYGDRDIYSVKFKKDSTDIILLQGIVMDSLTSVPVEAKITIKNKMNKEVIGVFTSNSSTGKYLIILPEQIDFEISIEATDYQECTEQLYTSGIRKYTEINKNIKLCRKSK